MENVVLVYEHTAIYPTGKTNYMMIDAQNKAKHILWFFYPIKHFEEKKSEVSNHQSSLYLTAI